LSLTADELAELERWVKCARPLKAIYYRSVEYRFMDPDEVLNGQGTQLYGGRFAEVGVKAVYLAESDSGASNEVLTRKKRLGGHAQITIDKYPRIVFGVDVALTESGQLGAETTFTGTRRDSLVPLAGSWQSASNLGSAGSFISKRCGRWPKLDCVPGELRFFGA
jgi:hypothetical protein